MFLFFTGMARAEHTAMCVSDFPARILNKQVEEQYHYAFVNLVCVAGTLERREKSKDADGVRTVEPFQLLLCLKFCQLATWLSSLS